MHVSKNAVTLTALAFVDTDECVLLLFSPSLSFLLVRISFFFPSSARLKSFFFFGAPAATEGKKYRKGKRQASRTNPCCTLQRPPRKPKSVRTGKALVLHGRWCLHKCITGFLACRKKKKHAAVLLLMLLFFAPRCVNAGCSLYLLPCFDELFSLCAAPSFSSAPSKSSWILHSKRNTLFVLSCDGRRNSGA